MRTGRTWVLGAVAAVAMGLVVVTVLVTGGQSRADAGGPLGPGPAVVELRVNHSRFSPETLTVQAGTEVRFVIVNDDPIAHEFIVGDESVHRRHESGTESSHPPVPGEVSVPAGGQAETTFTFAQPGEVVFACHLPGHLAYGMRGVVTVVPAG